MIKIRIRKFIRKIILNRIYKQIYSIRRWSGYLCGDVNWISEQYFVNISQSIDEINREIDDMYNEID